MNLTLNVTEVKQLLTKAIPAGKNILIKGAPGCGKTHIIDQVCEDLDVNEIVMHPAISDPTDFKGFPVYDKETGTAHFVPFGELLRILNANKRTVVFIDDIGQAPVSVQAALMQLIYGGRVNGFKIPDSVVFIGATNRKADKAGVSGLLEPVKSRFTTIVELAPTLSEWLDWAADHGQPADLMAFLQWQPQYFNAFEATGDLTNSPTCRNLAGLGDLRKMDLPESSRFAVFAGAVGAPCATAYNGFLALLDNLGEFDPNTVIANPLTAKVPDEANIAYALGCALIGQANVENIENIITYSMRLRPEICTFIVHTATVKRPELTQNAGFVKYCKAFNKVLI